MYPPDCRADLHCHSTASDGYFKPAQLVAHAAAANIELLALTDHDTTAGLDEAAAAAQAHGLNFLSGVEISVSWEGKTLHLLGLDIDPGCPELRAGLGLIQQTRVRRAIAIAQQLEKLGVQAPLPRAEALAAGGQVTRTHFARLLVEDGLVTDMKQAFKRFLAAGKPAFVSTQWASLEEAIDWIHAAGGLAVLAHPLRYKFTNAWRQRMLHAFKSAGGDALEVSGGSSQQAHELETCARDALRHELLASAGSDFHSPDQRWLRYGRLAPLSSRLTPVWTQFSPSSGLT